MLEYIENLEYWDFSKEIEEFNKFLGLWLTRNYMRIISAIYKDDPEKIEREDGIMAA